jgi:hypothetical protein
MSLTIHRYGDKYRAYVTPPHGDGIHSWSNAEPLDAQELIRRLREQGCHSRDIDDALFEADPMWLNRLEHPEGDDDAD